MKGSLAANRYAQALLELVIEQGKLEEVYSDMVLVKETIEASKDLENLLKSPIVKPDQKLAILKQIFGDKISEVTVDFIELISRRRREALLKDIADSFIALYKKEKNIIVANVTSAVQLDDSQKSRIVELLKTDATVEINEKIDASIIGGFILRVDDKQIDASILREFNDLKKTLVLN